MKVLIVGEIPFIDEVERLCRRAAHDVRVFLVEDLLSAIEAQYDHPSLNDFEIAIELHNESTAIKAEILSAMGEYLPHDALILTSALPTSVTVAASWVSHPERVVGFGVLPPVPDEGIIELAGAMQTAEGSLAEAELFWRGLGQETLLVADGPGLVRARTVCCLINEAASLLMEGVASAADIDRAMQLGMNYPIGPLAWGDLIGLDAVLGVMTGLFREWGEDRYRPTPLIPRMVAAGMLGRKTGRGFFTYDDA